MNGKKAVNSEIFSLTQVLLVTVFVIAFGAFLPNVAFAQYDDAVFSSGLDFGSNNFGSGYDNAVYNSGLDYGSTNYGSGYDNAVYNSGLNYGSTDYGSGSGYDNAIYNSDLTSGSTNYGVGAGTDNFSPTCPTCTDNFSPSATQDNFSPASTVDNFSPYSATDNFSPTATYSANCNCYTTPSAPYGYNSYGTSATYGASSYMPSVAYSAIPTFATPYLPSIAVPTIAAAPTFAPRIATQTQRAPTFSTAAPQTQSQTQTSTNVNPNSNTNVNATSPIRNTNNPVAVANASNGPITINNTVNSAPVAPVAQYPVQHPIQYTFPTPSCTISSSNGYNNGYNSGYNYNNYNYNNQQMTLTWVSSNGTSAYISPNVGSVNPNGSTTVYPNGYTTYTMTVTGSGGTGTCQTTANYAYTAPAYVAPAAPYVSLSQIPYTGFDYGPVGNAIYWMSLLAFAVAAGYLIVYHRGGAFAFAAGMLSRRQDASYELSGMDAGEPASEPEAKVASIPAIAGTPIAARGLPTVENNKMTTDSMILDHSTTGTPRIVIARG